MEIQINNQQQMRRVEMVAGLAKLIIIGKTHQVKPLAEDIAIIVFGITPDVHGRVPAVEIAGIDVQVNHIGILDLSNIEIGGTL